MTELKVKKLPKATHEGTLTIGEKEIPCAVLEDGSRILLQTAVFKAFDRPQRGNARLINVPPFLDAQNLQPFMDEEVREKIKLIDFTSKSGKKMAGYSADILPKICKIYLDARAANVLKSSQLPLARASEILLLGLANIGIIALVDEATGYQYERERDELQKILKAYIAAELLPWQRQFPDIFYKEIFRLNGWDFTVKGIKQRPSVIGKWTNTLIYEQLPPGVLTELKKKTPKSAAGNYSANFHQSLTPDLGQVHLQNQLASVITLFQISDNWQNFMAQFNKLMSRRLGQQELNFEAIPKPKELPKPKASFDTHLKGLLAVPPPKKEEILETKKEGE